MLRLQWKCGEKRMNFFVDVSLQIARSRKGKTESEITYPYFEVDRLPETRQSFYRVCLKTPAGVPPAIGHFLFVCFINRHFFGSFSHLPAVL